MAVVPYSPTAGGLPTGKYTGGARPEGARFVTNKMYQARYIAVLKAPREGNPLVAQILLGFAYLQKGEHGSARAAFVKVQEVSPDNPVFLTPLAAGQAAAGQWREARALLAKVEGAKDIMAFPVAFIHVRLGDKDRAFAWLERSYRNREFFMGCVRGWPELDPLRSDPRYHALVERMRFPPWGQPAVSR